jgi:hypothetical protein
MRGQLVLRLQRRTRAFPRRTKRQYSVAWLFCRQCRINPQSTADFRHLRKHAFHLTSDRSA